MEKAYPRNTFPTVLAVLVVLLILIWSISIVPRLVAPPAPVLAVTMQQRAWYACAAHVAEQFQLSFFEAERYRVAGVATLSGDTYRATIAYPNQGRTISCTIQHTPSGGWQLLELK